MAGKKKTAAKAKRRAAPRKKTKIDPRKGAPPFKIRRSKPKPKPSALAEASPALAEAIDTAEQTFAPKTEATTDEEEPPQKIGNCFNCGADCTEEDRCHGCKAFVCNECDQRQYTGAMGPHTKEDHLVGPNHENV